MTSRPVSRILFPRLLWFGDHPSSRVVANTIKRSTRKLDRADLERFLSDLAPGGVYLADRITAFAGGLLHHRFTLTSFARGGLLSVALSRGLPRVGVTHHLALWSPDFPRHFFRSDAAARATRLNKGIQ